MEHQGIGTCGADDAYNNAYSSQFASLAASPLSGKHLIISALSVIISNL